MAMVGDDGADKVLKLEREVLWILYFVHLKDDDE